MTTSLMPDEFQVVFRQGDGSREWTFFLASGRVLRVGRAPTSDIVVDMDGVSALHAELFTRPSAANADVMQLCIRDNSKNGTGVRPGRGGQQKAGAALLGPGSWEAIHRGSFKVLHDGWQFIVPLRNRAKVAEDMPELRRTITVLLGKPAKSSLRLAAQPGELDGDAFDEEEEENVARSKPVLLPTKVSKRVAVRSANGRMGQMRQEKPLVEQMGLKTVVPGMPPPNSSVPPPALSTVGAAPVTPLLSRTRPTKTPGSGSITGAVPLGLAEQDAVADHIKAREQWMVLQAPKPSVALGQAQPLSNSNGSNHVGPAAMTPHLEGANGGEAAARKRKGKHAADEAGGGAGKDPAQAKKKARRKKARKRKRLAASSVSEQPSSSSGKARKRRRQKEHRKVNSARKKARKSDRQPTRKKGRRQRCPSTESASDTRTAARRSGRRRQRLGTDEETADSDAVRSPTLAGASEEEVSATELAPTGDGSCSVERPLPEDGTSTPPKKRLPAPPPPASPPPALIDGCVAEPPPPPSEDSDQEPNATAEARPDEDAASDAATIVPDRLSSPSVDWGRPTAVG
eukprot:TRINITY_DN44721_c0_g1_i2.p1 TRINITY_DN44721_c0_g1~~TRINITY_DN44721_c0_g1_i2.p1  ORF type:complete len:572 (-),score=119.77 TRINITY_DN44721_c0_g1_i2:591-2306(-)